MFWKRMSRSFDNREYRDPDHKNTEEALQGAIRLTARLPNFLRRACPRPVGKEESDCQIQACGGVLGCSALEHPDPLPSSRGEPNFGPRPERLSFAPSSMSWQMHG